MFTGHDACDYSTIIFKLRWYKKVFNKPLTRIILDKMATNYSKDIMIWPTMSPSFVENSASLSSLSSKKLISVIYLRHFFVDTKLHPTNTHRKTHPKHYFNRKIKVEKPPNIPSPPLRTIDQNNGKRWWLLYKHICCLFVNYYFK